MNSKLFIDTTNRDKQIIRLNGKTFKVKGDLVSFIAQTLQKEKVSFDQIKEIKINRGPGSFTGLRVSAAVANALRYALGLQKDAGDLILPKYGRPPNIGKRKRVRRLDRTRA